MDEVEYQASERMQVLHRRLGFQSIIDQRASNSALFYLLCISRTPSNERRSSLVLPDSTTLQHIPME
jgi:hypothetical protein